MTQLESAVKGIVTDEMKTVALEGLISEEEIRLRVAEGQIVIPCNKSRRPKLISGIGAGLRTKVNASIGTSSDIVDIDNEVKKAVAAQESGADTLMELSVGGDLDEIRRRVIDAVDIPVGNVPLYQAFCDAAKKYHDTNKMDPEELFDLIEKQCADGLSFMAVHCGINLYTLERLRKQGYRYGGLVSKGGSFLVKWMIENNRENPLYEQFDRVTAILKKYDVVLSLGNGLRAGAIHDSSDRAQVQELLINCELAEEGRRSGCQMMVEGPGHVPIDEIEANIILQKRMSNNAPYYMLGPIPTDVAAGYDHISAAIGASLSSRYGADLVCYITPAEHLALPNVEDVREGVKAARVAVHTGDIVKLKEAGRRQDLVMGKTRRKLKWDEQFDLCLFPEDARRIRNDRVPSNENTCTMCGSFCALDNANDVFDGCLSPEKR